MFHGHRKLQCVPRHQRCSAGYHSTARYLRTDPARVIVALTAVTRSPCCLTAALSAAPRATGLIGASQILSWRWTTTLRLLGHCPGLRGAELVLWLSVRRTGSGLGTLIVLVTGARAAQAVLELPVREECGSSMSPSCWVMCCTRPELKWMALLSSSIRWRACPS
jgi:hypothetical protein